MASQDKIEFMKGLAANGAGQFEGEWLEFKRAPAIDGQDVKENWSKALAGFANTGGGVVIWGIKAAKDPETGIESSI